MTKPTLISGIQPSGRLHIGNYLGALKNFVELQNSGKYNCFFFVADYHSITTDFDSEKKSEEIKDVVRAYLRAGLDPKKSTIFIQSAIPYNTEFSWILSTITPFGDLSRMTQFKDKSSNQSNNINAGLFFYPVLMAADILLYDAKFVPVGDDQIQHLEITRRLARKFNSKFGDTLLDPKPLLTDSARVMSLNDPEIKMSKSIPSGCLFLDDSPEDIKKKVSEAVTDSGSEIKYDEENKKAISNLILIYSQISELSIREVEKKFKDKSYADFKAGLANLLIEKLSIFRDRKITDSKVKSIIKKGNKKAYKVAEKKIEEVKQAIGFSV